MLFEKLQSNEIYTSSEKAIIEFLLSGKEDISEYSTIRLAEITHTSKATVTRLYQKLGYHSYREFQKQYNREWIELQNINARLDLEPINRTTTYEDIAIVLPVIYENAITETKLSLDKNMIKRVIQHLHQAKSIDIYGSGVTYSIAQLCAFKFRTLGIRCGAYSGLNEHYIMADKNPKEKAVIIFSLTGGNSAMIHVAKWLKKRNYYVIGIGGEQKKELKSFCTEYISVPMEKNILGMEIIKGFNGINYTMDVLFTSLLVKNYDYNREVAVRILREE